MKRLLICGWLLVAGAGLAAQSNAPVAPPAPWVKPDAILKPSIIVIMAHDLGYGDLHCYGQQKVKTPNLDLMAGEGMRFTQVYAGSPLSAPSRGVLLTGKHTGHAWIRGGTGDTEALRAEDMTVAEQLRGGGYKTCAIGFWGLGPDGSSGVPGKKGFEDWVGYLTHQHAQNYYPDLLWRNQELSQFDENAKGARRMYSHDMFTRVALNYIRINSPDVADPNRRYFLYLSYTIPHADMDLAKKTGNGLDVPSDEPYSRTDWPQAAKNRAAMIARLDADVGKILAQVKKSKADDKTIIFFTSDNGPVAEGGADPKFFNSTGSLRGMKGDLYEGGLRVPMIVRWPGRISPGKTNDTPWSFADFMPTALELARVEPPKGLDGRSVVPLLLTDNPASPHEFLYWELPGRPFQQAVRMGDWKAVRSAPGKALQLYNLKKDPAESKDVAPGNSEVVGKIDKFLKTARTEPGRTAVEAKAPRSPTVAAGK